jgi:alkanesulfonate monooxygenase SsuD/methylene tetrahydromethanopterin reductase-like flavin-dependent oxidoreductase (luciferase family)
MERKYWAFLSTSASMAGVDLASAVQNFETRGFTGVMMPQMYGPPFGPLAAAAALTSQLELASAITMGLTRSPFETAMATIDLDRISKGRFTLGLGTGPGHFTQGYYGMPYDRPVSRLREVVEILRHVEYGVSSGTMEPWQGRHYQLEFHGYAPTLPLQRSRVPVWIAALRERMCELAGEVADGLIGHPVWSVEWALGQAQESLAAGAARSGRDPHEIDFTPWVYVSMNHDGKKAVAAAKPQVAYYGGFAQYHDYFAAHGFAAEARRLQEASNSMQPTEAAALVPDEMARTFVACGTPDQVRERIEPLWQRATSMVLRTPNWGLSTEDQTAALKLLSEVFYDD